MSCLVGQKEFPNKIKRNGRVDIELSVNYKGSFIAGGKKDSS